MFWRVVHGVCLDCGKGIICFQLVDDPDSPITGVSWNHSDGVKYRHLIVPKMATIVSQGEVK